MKSHKDLEVWKVAVELAGDVYKVTKTFPKEEQFGLVNQMCRAAVSVASNIAEGAARGTNKEFVHFLHTAAGSASVLDTQLEISKIVGVGQLEALEKLQTTREHVSKMLHGLIRSVKQRDKKP